MTEPTLFEMDLPRAAADEAKAKQPKRSANWFPQNNTEMLMRGYEPNGGPQATCRACNAPIEWWMTPTGRKLPMNPMPTPETPAIAHWSTCTNPDRFRKAKR
jgi:hypothetical protein